MKRFLLVTRMVRKFSPVYDDPPNGTAETATTTTATETEGGTPGETTTTTADPPEPPPEPDPITTSSDPFRRLKFTTEQQKFFNQRMADERKKLQSQNEKTIRELEKLKQNQTLTTKQKDELQVRIDELQSQFMSKEELLRKEKEKLSKEHQSAVQHLTAERDTWRDRFHYSTISRALMDAAIRNDSYNPEQIVAILERNTRLVDEVDAEGKPTGGFVPMVKLSDQDTDGKPIVLDLSVNDAVKRMKDSPDKYGNLFKSGVAGGLGQNGTTPSRGRPIDPTKMTTEQYMRWRKEHPGLDINATRR